MPTLQQWLAQYGESHQNKINKTVHWICVPVIFFSITGLLFCVKLPFQIGGIQGNLAIIVMLGVIIYYLFLSKTLWIGMMIFCAACLLICQLIANANGVPLWLVAIVLFVVAWIGQFYGHKIEGKKPAFLKDLQFLLIGPAWLMSFIYQKIGVKY